MLQFACQFVSRDNFIEIHFHPFPSTSIFPAFFAPKKSLITNVFLWDACLFKVRIPGLTLMFCERRSKECAASKKCWKTFGQLNPISALFNKERRNEKKGGEFCTTSFFSHPQLNNKLAGLQLFILVTKVTKIDLKYMCCKICKWRLCY